MFKIKYENTIVKQSNEHDIRACNGSGIYNAEVPEINILLARLRWTALTAVYQPDKLR